MPVLSAEDRAFWEEHGYVVVRNAVPPENCAAAARAVWEFLEMDADNPASWYPDPQRRTIMVEIYQHQALWDNRQFPRVHQAFAEIWGTEKLWVSFDRASMNPPERPDWPFPGPHLHWDMKLEMPVTLKVQGVLYLTDTPAEQGAFTCIPGFQRKLEGWLQSLSPDAEARKVIREASGAQPIGGKAGDLVIWHSALPHGSRPNTAQRPRLAQYISMFPAREENEEGRQRRITGWQERLTGLGKDQQEKEHFHGRTAELTPLGRKLLGLDRWAA
jgi:ectoine hydroxylase-related dioxygenase (phytanoyl-CoA dioxygenase family)